MGIKRKIKSKIKHTLVYLPLLPRKYHCSVCGSNVAVFFSTGVKADIFMQKRIIGGGYRKNVLCPICGANDRIRFVDYILKEKTDIYTNPDLRILHFAPEKCIEAKIRKSAGGYITGDIVPGRADKVVDATNISYPDKEFDYVIINHVLEHIPDEKKAMLEIRRVLKEDGKCVFSMPICVDQDTYESKDALTDSERLLQYGQKDHVRLYGRDAKTRMEKYGFRITEYITDEILSDEEIKNMHVMKGDRVFLGEVI